MNQADLTQQDGSDELAAQPDADTVLQLNDLRVRFPVARDWRGRVRQYAHALNGVDLAVRRGEVFGVVGESGCGKSTLAQVIMGLLPPSSGSVVRGLGNGGAPANFQIVFQDPQSSLDPRLPVWRVIMEPLVVRERLARAQLRTRAAALAEQVGLRAEHIDRYVHEFSGGQRQRIAVARALASGPDLIVLDEPTSALDISVQAQILNLLQELRARLGLTYVLISHNVSVVRHLCDRVAVMYLGQVLEQGSASAVLDTPRHPYTRELLAAVPRLDRAWNDAPHAMPAELPGNRSLPEGCFFRERCSWATAGCELPQDFRHLEKKPQHQFRCHVALRKF